jgi:ABC-type sugar transport system permease subunit
MFQRLWAIWLPRWLFRTTLFVAAILIFMVFLSPVFDDGAPNPQRWRRVVAVCARDLTFRRIALASAAALAVTAFVFFRPLGFSQSQFRMTDWHE